MKNEDFEQMRILADETEREIIYKDSLGFYNFQKLEDLLQEYGISEEDLDQEADKSAHRLESMSGGDFSIQDHVDIKEKLRSCVIIPSYKDTRHWYKWTDILSLNDISDPLNINNEWKIIYKNDMEGIQLLKKTENMFISILGPRRNFYGQPAPIFWIYVDKNDSFLTEQYSGYNDVMSDISEKFSEALPSEDEIESAVKEFELSCDEKPINILSFNVS